MTILSDPGRTLRIMAVNPWQRLAEDWPQVRVSYADLGSPHRWGVTRWRAGRPVAVVLHRDLTQVQRRCTLAHELEHLDRGAPCETLRAAIERRVITATAKYLLPDIAVLGDALGAYDLRRAADELWVTYPVLIDRIRAFTEPELTKLTDGWEDRVA